MFCKHFLNLLIVIHCPCSEVLHPGSTSQRQYRRSGSNSGNVFFTHFPGLAPFLPYCRCTTRPPWRYISCRLTFKAVQQGGRKNRLQSAWCRHHAQPRLTIGQLRTHQAVWLRGLLLRTGTSNVKYRRLALRADTCHCYNSSSCYDVQQLSATTCSLGGEIPHGLPVDVG